ncbi:hypothetical protein NT06LI_2682, partial [Listeria innocua FSL J1-023]
GLVIPIIFTPNASISFFKVVSFADGKLVVFQANSP